MELEDLLIKKVTSLKDNYNIIILEDGVGTLSMIRIENNIYKKLDGKM